MKKLILPFLVIFALGTFSSCRKCIECEWSWGGDSDVEKECYSSVSERKEKEKEADAACEVIKAWGGTCKCKPTM